jgi:DNA modification methylase
LKARRRYIGYDTCQEYVDLARQRVDVFTRGSG